MRISLLSGVVCGVPVHVLSDELNAFATSDLAVGVLFSELLCIVF